MIQPAARCLARKAKPPAGSPTGGSDYCFSIFVTRSENDPLRLALVRTLAFVVLLRRTIGSRVVLVAIDVAAYLILLMVHLGAFTLRQMPAVGCAVRVNFLMDRRFFAFEVARFARRQLPRANALADARLLVTLTRVYRSRPAVVFRREVCMVHARGMFVRRLQ
jgi:hypothetical protein